MIRKNVQTIASERRSFLHAAIAGVVGMALGARMGDGPGSASRQVSAEPAPASAKPGPAGHNVLLAYFSRAGENYDYGDRINLEVGNTEVLARMISDRIDGDVYEIEAAEPYSDSYDETVARNVEEQDADARPAIATPMPSIGTYDTVLLGSPIWNVRPPMIMSTFAESFDFTGKTVIPFVTYAVSGMGNTERVYRKAFRGADFGEGLAIRGEEVRESDAAVDSWLQDIGLLNT